MNRARRAYWLAMLLIMLIATGCGQGAQTPGPTPTVDPKLIIQGRPHIRGLITGLTTSPARMVVEGQNDGDTIYNKATVELSPTTTIFRTDTGALAPATLADIQTGQRVEVFFTTAVLLSPPVQATAAVVIILPASRSTVN